MKVILVLVTLLLLAADLYIPEDSYLRTIGRKQTTVCSITYSDEEEAFIFEDSLANCNLIEVHALPPPADITIPVNARFVKGSYSLVLPKSPGLAVGGEYVLEDLLTGKTYNLKSESPYTFNVSRTIPDRFVMHVKKTGASASK